MLEAVWLDMVKGRYVPSRRYKPRVWGYQIDILLTNNGRPISMRFDKDISVRDSMSKEKAIKCTECGGENVYYQAWIKANAGDGDITKIQEPVGDWDEIDTKWCDDCDDHTKLEDPNIIEENIEEELSKKINEVLLESQSRCLDDEDDRNTVLQNLTVQLLEWMEE